jgi:hypothetical protein
MVAPWGTDPALALRVYRQSMRRGEDEKATLRALVERSLIKREADTPRLDRQSLRGSDQVIV